MTSNRREKPPFHRCPSCGESPDDCPCEWEVVDEIQVDDEEMKRILGWLYRGKETLQ